jgi:hypothetical protein
MVRAIKISMQALLGVAYITNIDAAHAPKFANLFGVFAEIL